MLALEQEPEIVNAFGYDEMPRSEVLLRPLFHHDPNFTRRPVTDADVTAVQAWLQWKGFRRLGRVTAHEAIDKHAREHSFHPVHEYLEALGWDEKPRLETWLHVITKEVKVWALPAERITMRPVLKWTVAI